MSAHAPKTAALIAYDAGALSAEGVRRIEAHLSRCETCRTELASIRLFDQLVEGEQCEVEETRGAPFGSMPLELRRVARQVAGQARESHPEERLRGAGSATGAALFIAAAAVAALAFGTARSGSPDARGVEPLPPTTVSTQSGTRGEITLLSGTALRGTFAGAQPMRVGSTVEESDRIWTGPESAAHLRLGDETGIVLGENSELRLAQLRRAAERTDVVLELVRGAVSSEVAVVDVGGRYVVQAGPWEVEVRGTRFRVEHDAGAFGVKLSEGRVWIYRDGRLVQQLEAPASFGAEDDSEVPPVHGLAREVAPTAVTLPGLPVDTWEIDGRLLTVAAATELFLSPGEHTVVGRRSGQELFREVVRIDGAHFAIEAGAPLNERPIARSGDLDPAMIAPVVRRGMPRLRACQGRAARGGEEVWGRFVLRITIGSRGTVSAAELIPQDRAAPASFERCVVTQTQSWVFPAPTGGPVRFEQPLRFTTRF